MSWTARPAPRIPASGLREFEIAKTKRAGGIGALDLPAEFLLYPLALDFQGRSEQPVVHRPGIARGDDSPHPDVAWEGLQALVRPPDQALLVGLPCHRDARQERPALTDQNALLENG